MKNRSRTLLIWIAVLAAPMVLSLVGYLVADPFCVLHRGLYAPGFPVAINRDYASTELAGVKPSKVNRCPEIARTPRCGECGGRTISPPPRRLRKSC